jgi:hypothetical protein
MEDTKALVFSSHIFYNLNQNFMGCEKTARASIVEGLHEKRRRGVHLKKLPLVEKRRARVLKDYIIHLRMGLHYSRSRIRRPTASVPLLSDAVQPRSALVLWDSRLISSDTFASRRTKSEAYSDDSWA